MIVLAIQLFICIFLNSRLIKAYFKASCFLICCIEIHPGPPCVIKAGDNSYNSIFTFSNDF